MAAFNPSSNYPHLLEQVESNLAEGRGHKAMKGLLALLTSALKQVYAQIKLQAPPKRARRLLDMEERINDGQTSAEGFDFQEMVTLFQEADLFAHHQGQNPQGGTLNPAPIWDAMAEVIRTASQASGNPDFNHVAFLCAAARLWLDQLGLLAHGPAPANLHDRSRTGRPLPSAKPPPQRLAQFTEPLTAMEFVWIEGGAFDMGDQFDEGLADEKPVHRVVLEGFYMGRCPVTQAQWQRIMDDNPSSHVGDPLPVEQVGWPQVQRFIERLNQHHQEAWCFYLPSEAQWEYAARSGGRHQRYAGADDPLAVAWFGDNSDGRTQPVGLKKPNGLGLHDMSGNIWEWCRDRYREDAYTHPEVNHPFAPSQAPDRVIRGGCYSLDAWSVRCARRMGYNEEYFGAGVGFRLVMLPASPSSAPDRI